MKDLQGTPISEEQCAKEFGFNDVFEFRRWTSDMGSKVFELENEVRRAKDEADRLRINGIRGHKLLKRIEQHLDSIQDYRLESEEKELLFATRVLLNKEVDWGNTLKWLSYEQIRKDIENGEY